MRVSECVCTGACVRLRLICACMRVCARESVSTSMCARVFVASDFALRLCVCEFVHVCGCRYVRVCVRLRFVNVL